MTSKLKLVDADKQAQWFERLREAHQTETAEDYVELIADLIEANGEARITELAKRFGVSHPTVTKVIERLKKEGLVTSEPYRSIFLTSKGEKIAQYCKERHNIVVEFLLSLGISQKTADIDSEGIEHHVSEETLTAFKKFVENQGCK